MTQRAQQQSKSAVHLLALPLDWAGHKE